MSLSIKKFNLLLVATLVSLIVGSLALTVFAVSLIANKSDYLISVKLDTELSSSKRENLLRYKADLIKNKSYLEIIDKIVPTTKDQALAVAELLQIAKENNITLGSISFPASELGSKSSKTSSGSNVTQTKPVEGISGVLGIELNLSQITRTSGDAGSGISYDQLISTLQAIETNRRTMQIKNLQIQPITRSGVVIGYSPSLTINIFVKQ